MTDTNNAKIYAAIAAVMKEVNAITKDQKNEIQRYNYRSIDDVYNELHDIMAKHEVFTTAKVIESKSNTFANNNGKRAVHVQNRYEFTFHTTDGSSLSTEAIGESIDTSDKACNKASSMAHKTALLQTFLIPTKEDKDPDKHSHEIPMDQSQPQNANQRLRQAQQRAPQQSPAPQRAPRQQPRPQQPRQQAVPDMPPQAPWPDAPPPDIDLDTNVIPMPSDHDTKSFTQNGLPSMKSVCMSFSGIGVTPKDIEEFLGRPIMNGPLTTEEYALLMRAYDKIKEDMKKGRA